MTEQLQIEATGETVGEAKWSALRELERLQPGLDKATVKFQVISEGERGLLGVGFAPARVLATVDADADGDSQPSVEVVDESELAGTVRELLERIVGAIGVHARLEIEEDEETLTAAFSGRDLGGPACRARAHDRGRAEGRASAAEGLSGCHHVERRDRAEPVRRDRAGWMSGFAAGSTRSSRH